MDPFRTAGFRCPSCEGGPPLREYQSRLCCDECRGMLIDEQDFVASCADLYVGELVLHTEDEKPTDRFCPRCERTLARSKLTLMPVEIELDVMRCTADGLWLSGVQLSRTFAVIARKGGGHGGSRYWETGGPPGLDGISRRRAATDGLRISDWSNRPRRRRPTASPINLYSEQQLLCPICTSSELRFFGDRYACAQCSGTFVQNGALEGMVMDISKTAFDLPPPSGAAGMRACPVCHGAMIVEELEGVPIDRCAEHGVWFDPNELTVALERASGQFEPHGLRAWMRRLFS
jgi:Zn-finger nucleic acid-binding protein